MMTVELVAHNSTRNTVCCLVCGQAAGAAGALSAALGIAPAQLDIAALRRHLLDAGVLLTPKAEPIEA
jgi:hypothetical protein